ncbi:MAG: XRE family transcriptional regulator, partial [Lachnospiraceae bacterium]|nr:XRE family transcriptional regulator [Lachnospiraceae bacterium]
MICAYDKLYLEKARVALGRMLDFAVYELKYDVTVFFDTFIASGVAKEFENGDAGVVVGKSGVELAYEVLERTGSMERRM